jgi:hypothetical protein
MPCVIGGFEEDGVSNTATAVLVVEISSKAAPSAAKITSFVLSRARPLQKTIDNVLLEHLRYPGGIYSQ